MSPLLAKMVDVAQSRLKEKKQSGGVKTYIFRGKTEPQPLREGPSCMTELNDSVVLHVELHKSCFLFGSNSLNVFVCVFR